MSEHTTPTLPIAAATNTTQAGLKNEISESNRSSQLVAPAANLGHQAVTDALREQEAKVQGSNVAKWIELVYFVVLAMGAALFLALAVLSSHANGSTPGSTWQTLPPLGLNRALLQASQFGPTVFPILFAAILGSTCRLVARHRAERLGGSKLKTLELLVSSNSLFSTGVALFKLRRLDLPGFGLLAIWILSPVGGQASLRVLSVQNTTIATDVPYQWLDNSARHSLFSSSNITEEYKSSLNAANAQYLTALVSETTNSGCDVFGFPRVQSPLGFDDSVSWNSTTFDQFSASSFDTSDNYESLLGVPTYFSNVGGDPSTLSLQYDIRETLFRFSCQSVSTHHIKDNWTSILNKSTIARSNSIVEDMAAQGAGFFIDTDTPFPSKNEVQKRARHIIFGSVYFSQITVADCYVLSSETTFQVSWNPQFCGVSAFLKSRNYRAQTQLDDELTCTSIFQTWPQVGRVKGQSTPTEQFMSTLFSTYPAPLNVDLSSLSNTRLSQLLTTAFNTYWISSQYFGEFGNPDQWWGNDGDHDVVSGNSEGAISTFSVPRMVYDPAWGPTLIVISLILILAACFNIYLRWMVLGPDILGHVSSMTRADPNIVGAGEGMDLDGMDRARVLGEMPFSINRGASSHQVEFRAQDGSRLGHRNLG